ncbi:MAG: PTS glucose transporter subunit IIA [Spirochaetota bacterium]
MNLITVYAPAAGEVLPLESVDDEVFAEKLVGEGLALRPEEPLVCSPISGHLEHLFQSHHAFSIIREGIEVLVHIGLESLKTKGAGFALYNENLSEGDCIQQAQPILQLDLNFLRRTIPSLDSPVVVTNYDEIADFQVMCEYGSKVKRGDPIFCFTRKK